MIHIGGVDFIAKHHGVDPNIVNLNKTEMEAGFQLNSEMNLMFCQSLLMEI